MKIKKLFLHFFVFAFICITGCSIKPKLIEPEISNGYFVTPIFKRIFYLRAGNNWVFPKRFVDANRRHFKVVGPYIAKDDKFVFVKSKKVRNVKVDVDSFRMEKGVLKDHKNVFYSRIYGTKTIFHVKGADVDTFEYISINNEPFNEKWAKDKNNYFQDHDKIDVDYNTLKFVDNDLLYDKNKVYITSGTTFSEVDIVKGKVEKINRVYAIMGDFVICNIWGYEKIKVEKKKPIKVFDDLTILVGNKLIHRGELFKYKNVDIQTYKLIGDRESSDSFRYSADKNNVYYEELPIVGADIETFELINVMYSKDKKNVYYKNNSLPEENPNSFFIGDWGNGIGEKGEYRDGILLETTKK